MITTGVSAGFSSLDMYNISGSTADFTNAAHLAILEAELKALGGVQMIGTPTNSNHDVRVAVQKGLGVNKSVADSTAVAAAIAAAIGNSTALGTMTVTVFTF